MLLEHPHQFVLGLIVFLQHKQWTHFVEYEHSIQAGTLTSQNPLDVQPILRTARKYFQHYQIFRRAGDQRQTRFDRESTRAFDNPRLVGQAAKRDVNRNAIGRFDKHDAVLESEAARVGQPAAVMSQNWIDEPLFSTHPAQQGDVDVPGLARLAPALDGEPSDHTELPPSRRDKRLEIHRRPKEPVHVERRCSRACCSTRPDHCCRSGGKGTSRALSMRSSDAHSARASSSARSSCQRRRSSTCPVSTHRLTYSRSSSVVTSIRITARRREVDSKHTNVSVDQVRGLIGQRSKGFNTSSAHAD